MPLSRPPYPWELRRRISDLARAGRTVVSIGREFKPTENMTRNWIAQSERDAGIRTEELTTANQRVEFNRLRRELRALREERDILRKASAWFAQETDATPRRSSDTWRHRSIGFPSPGCPECWRSCAVGSFPGMTAGGTYAGRKRVA